MSENLFMSAVHRRNTGRPPVWFMRQAGRYHSHYQQMKERYSFIELCKVPEAAAETTFGPIRDFDFDAAILFSDLLFPLEVMGMPLTYDPGPKLGWYLTSLEKVRELQGGPAQAEELASRLMFQAESMRLIREGLSPDKGLIGFVGGPLTLFFYAVSGSHHGDLSDSLRALKDGRFEAFREKLTELLARNMALQAEAGADVMAMLDTCGGEITAEEFREIAVPATRAVLERFKQLCPDTPVVYYSKGTGPEQWESLRPLPIDGLGIDWRHDIAEVLDRWSDRFAIQGNVDPEWIRDLPAAELEKRIRAIFAKVKALPAEKRRGWICGLGHGVLPKTPEENVRLFLRVQKEMFGNG